MPSRVAIDANILIAGIVWPRWPHEVLMHAIQGHFVFVLSPIVVSEARRRITERFPDFLEEFETLLENIDYETAPVPTDEEVEAGQNLVRQEKDVPVALSVIAAEVDYLVSCDRDFTDQDETTERVREAIPCIMLPPVFLRDVMGWASEELEEIRQRDWEDLGE